MDGRGAQDEAGSRTFGWFPEYLLLGQRRIRAQGRLMGLSVLVGIVAGLGAISFYIASCAVERYSLVEFAGFQPVRPTGEKEIAWLPKAAPRSFNPWMLLLIPAVGGLLSGVLVFSIAPEAEGHGTDSVIESYHLRQGVIRPRVPIVKIIASAFTIGTGGSGGREGPMTQIGAGFGSLLGTLLRLGATDRRILVAAGMGAGIAAIFRAPLAGALFASEVLYGSPEFEPEVIMPAAIASVVAYCTFGIYGGWDPLFTTPNLTFSNPWELLPYLILVLFMVVLAALFTHSYYLIARLFHHMRVPPHFRPAIGAFLTGAVALGLYFLMGWLLEGKQMHVLAVLSAGYGAIQETMSDGASLSAWVLLAIALGKILTTGLTIASGGSGGVFGPSMVIGACGGGALGLMLHNWWPTLVPDPASFAVIGMAGFFAAAAKTPISSLVIVSEMTGGYHLLLPSLWVCALCFVLSDEKSIYSSQVESRSRSPAHRGAFAQDLVSDARVGQFIKNGQFVPTLLLHDSLATVLQRLESSSLPVIPVVNGDRRLLGVVNLEEVHLASQIRDVPLVAEDIMRDGVEPLTPDDQVDHAMELFAENDLLALPIVNDLQERKVIGIVRRLDVARTYLHHLHGGGVTPA